MASDIEIKILTMDSHTHTMRVDKSVPVPTLKQQIAEVTGVISDHQRLICRGKVLKDDQNLSAYHVEDGHKLHLVVRQPVAPSPEISDISEEDANQPLDSLLAELHSLLGSGSVDLEIRITEDEEPEVMPDSLTTITQRLNHLRAAFAHHVNRRRSFDTLQQNTDARRDSGSPTAALAGVVMNARQVLNQQVSECLLQLGQQLEGYANVTDSVERYWIEDSALRSGDLLHNLGITMLELARATTTTRMGQAPGDGVVNSMYMSPISPSPVPVQQLQLPSQPATRTAQLQSAPAIARGRQYYTPDPGMRSDSLGAYTEGGLSSRLRSGRRDNEPLSVQQPEVKRQRRG